MQTLKNDYDGPVPPGGGLDSKRTLVESIRERYQNSNNTTESMDNDSN